MTTKMPTIETFMVDEDERMFSKLIIESFPRTRFVDIYPWSNPNPPICESIANCSGPHSVVAILNEDINSLDNYRMNYVRKQSVREEYHGGFVGPGLIQYIKSKEADYLPGGLRNGSLAASYDPEKDPETDAFVKEVYKIFKKGAKKLYLIDPRTRVVNDKPETRFFAWPNAIEKYDRKNENYLTNHAMAYFTSIRE